jgi:hypothetical protein
MNQKSTEVQVFPSPRSKFYFSECRGFGNTRTNEAEFRGKGSVSLGSKLEEGRC